MSTWEHTGLSQASSSRLGRAEAESLLRSASLRVTQPRCAVLAVVHDHPHADVDTIASAARDTLPTVSTQAVYDVLAALTRAGLVRRIQPAGSPARFETRTGDNHHHLVCRICGAVQDVDCAVGQTPCLVPADDLGYWIDEADVVYWGLCPSCLVDRDRVAGAGATPPSAANSERHRTTRTKEK